MNWKMILKKMDYNQLSDYEKRAIFYKIVGDNAYEEIELGDFIDSFYDSEGYSEIPDGFAFPKDRFRLVALGGIEIYEDDFSVNFEVFAENTKKPSKKEGEIFSDSPEMYFIGDIKFDGKAEDYKMSNVDEDWKLTDLSFSDFIEFSESNGYLDLVNFNNFNQDADYNKLVSYLKEAGKWNDEDMASSMKPAKVSHRQEVNEWLEDAHGYATQKFEQSYSPQDDASIEDAQDFYKLLEYLETTNEDDWDENKMRRDFGAAMVIVSETLGGLP